jgi:hypothetical protein
MLDLEDKFFTSIKIRDNHWKVFKGDKGNYVAFCEDLRLTIQSPYWDTLIEDIGLGLDAIDKDLKK